MGPIWPFRKKKSEKPSISRSNYTKNVVEYERKTGEKKTDKKENHLEEKKFKDAMSLLSRKTEDD